MKKRTTSVAPSPTACVAMLGSESTIEPNASPRLSLLISAIVPSTISSSVPDHQQRRSLRFQYHSRRREMTSSSRSSEPVPYSDGVGIMRWATMSTIARKTTTTAIAPRSAQVHGQP